MKLFSKKPKITFSCSPNYFTAFELYKPKYAVEFSPPWLKHVPAIFHEEDKNGIKVPGSSIKRCPGLMWTLTSGFIMPLWTDIALTINPDGSWAYQCADRTTALSIHSRQQIPNFYEKYTHLKIESPWAISCNKEIKFYWTNPYYYYNEPTKYVLAHGMMEYKYNHSSNINLFFPIEKQSYSIMLKAGNPLVHMIDTSFTDFEIEYELLKDKLEFFSKYNYDSITHFVGDYFKRKKILNKGTDV